MKEIRNQWDKWGELVASKTAELATDWYTKNWQDGRLNLHIFVVFKSERRTLFAIPA